MKTVNIFASLFILAVSTTGSVFAGGANTSPSGNFLLFKAGTAQLSKDRQTVLGSQLSFDENAPAYALEWENRRADGNAFALEWIHYRHDYVAVTPGEMTTDLLMINYKKYFNGLGSFRPLLGAGIGVGVNEMDGPIVGDGSGFAFQVMGGFEYRFTKQVGLYGEVKIIGNKNEDDFNTKIDSSAKAAFLGLSVSLGR